MGNSMSDISSKSLTILEPCDKRYRGYILGDYFNQTLSANSSYGNYHAKDNLYYLSKCIIVRDKVIYLIDGKKTITLHHVCLNISDIIYHDAVTNTTISCTPNKYIFGQPLQVVDPTFNKMLNDPEYVDFYKKLASLLYVNDRCQNCIKARAIVKLPCEHVAYCRNCFCTISKISDPGNYSCMLCATIANPFNLADTKNIIPLELLD